jgi:pimeloyl-ACP methyl ester carboxylesterase
MVIALPSLGYSHDRSDREQRDDRDDLTPENDPIEIDRWPPAHLVSADQEGANRAVAQAKAVGPNGPADPAGRSRSRPTRRQLFTVWSHRGSQSRIDATPGQHHEEDPRSVERRDAGDVHPGESPGKSVLLFVHGGPGMPEYWLTQRYAFHLDELFTVAWWEQRGSGLSYEPGIPAKEMTSERFVADTLAVSNHLRDRSGTEKIYLMAHSWGSYIGLQAAAQAPAVYHAYVGVAQITHQIESEALAYEYMLQQYRKLGQTKMVRRLEAAPVTPTTIPLPASYDAVRDRAMHGLGVGTTRDMKSVVTGLFLPSWRFPEYTLREKANLWRGKIFSRRSGLWNRMLEADLTRRVPALGLPAYFLHGRHDYTVSYVLSRGYAQHLVAPLKGFYTFENSAHSPMFEEPERTLRILREEVLPGRNHLADPE